MFSSLDETTIYNNGVCVVETKSFLKNNFGVQYYNKVHVGDLLFMDHFRAFDVLAEIFFLRLQTLAWYKIH